MNMKSLLVVAMLAGCGGAKTEPVNSADSTPEDATPYESTTTWISFHDAIEKAQAQYPDGLPIEVEVENKDGKDLLEVEILLGPGEVREVYLDPATGDVVRDDLDDLDESEQAEIKGLAEAVAAAGASLNDAVDFALSKHELKEIIEVELEMHGEKLIIEVAVKGESKEQELIYDPTTKELLGKEVDGEIQEAAPTCHEAAKDEH